MTISRFLGSAFVVTVAMAAPAAAQPANFKPQATALFEAAFPVDGPGGAVVVMRGGKLLFTGARGIADLEAKRAITPGTMFKLGSITKQFVAAVVLQLVAEKKMSLDDPLSRFFPDFPQPGARATVRQLLNHSSGVQDYTKIAGWMGSEQTMRPFTTAELMAVIRGKPSVSEPGTRWEYNNSGYVLLGAIVEQVTGKPWHVAVVERIARPLGLKSIAYAQDVQASPAMARGYSMIEGRMQPSRGVHISVAHAAGGLVGNVGDLAKWAQALHHGRVVTPALYKEMTSPARLADGSTQPYGLGLRIREIRGRTAFVHGGAGRGLDTDSAYVPSEDLFVAVLSNTDDPATDPSVLVRRLAALALGDPIPVFARADVDIRTLEPLFGLYGSENGPPRRFFGRDGKLFIGRGDEEVPVIAAGDDRFAVAPDELTWFRIVRRADGTHAMEIHRLESGAVDRAVRTGPAPVAFAVAPEVLRSYVGTYATEVPVLTVALDGDGRLTIAPAGQSPMPMRPVSETEFRIDGSPMRLVFHPEKGETNRLTLYRGARELHGTRVNP